MNSSSSSRKISRIIGGAVTLGAAAAMLFIGSSADAATLSAEAESLTTFSSRTVMSLFARGI